MIGVHARCGGDANFIAQIPEDRAEGVGGTMTTRGNGRRRGASTPPRRPGVVILGSYRKHFPMIRNLRRKFELAGIQVLWPPDLDLSDERSHFPVFRATDGPDVTNRDLEQRVLEDSIRRPECDLVAVANFRVQGEPYVGKDTAAEIGWASCAGKFIVSVNPVSPADSPVLCDLVDMVMTPDQITDMITNDPSWFAGWNRRRRRRPGRGHRDATHRPQQAPLPTLGGSTGSHASRR
jgi:hypothetical protein